MTVPCNSVQTEVLWSRELQKKNLQYLDDNLDSWRMERRAKLMERMGASRAEVIAWWEQFRENDDAYRPLLRLYMEDDFLKAVGVVRQFHFPGRCGILHLHFDISLISAVWFLWDGHPNQVQLDGRMQIISSEAFV